jgi:hypothetical protein
MDLNRHGAPKRDNPVKNIGIIRSLVKEFCGKPLSELSSREWWALHREAPIFWNKIFLLASSIPHGSRPPWVGAIVGRGIASIFSEGRALDTKPTRVIELPIWWGGMAYFNAIGGVRIRPDRPQKDPWSLAEYRVLKRADKQVDLIVSCGQATLWIAWWKEPRMEVSIYDKGAVRQIVEIIEDEGRRGVGTTQKPTVLTFDELWNKLGQ